MPQKHLVVTFANPETHNTNFALAISPVLLAQGFTASRGEPKEFRDFTLANAEMSIIVMSSLGSDGRYGVVIASAAIDGEVNAYNFREVAEEVPVMIERRLNQLLFSDDTDAQAPQRRKVEDPNYQQIPNVPQPAKVPRLGEAFEVTLHHTGEHCYASILNRPKHIEHATGLTQSYDFKLTDHEVSVAVKARWLPQPIQPFPVPARIHVIFSITTKDGDMESTLDCLPYEVAEKISEKLSDCFNLIYVKPAF